MRIWLPAAAALLLLQGAAAAMQTPLDALAVGDALVLGQRRGERERARFHEPYRVVVDMAPVDYIELVTPFRRVVLEAEARVAVNDRTFGQRQALELLGTGPLTLDVIVEMTFHPLHTFVGVPAYGVRLVPREGLAVSPRGIDRIPRHGPRIDGAPRLDPGVIPLPTDQPMTGGAMIARFDAQVLNPMGQYDVVIDEAGKELARAPVNLARTR